MEDKEILDYKVGEQTIRSMTAIDFLHWLAKKIDGLQSYSAANVELSMAVTAPPITNNMEEGNKIRLVRKLLQAGVKL